MTTGPILFVSHDATPTGAPFLLLHLLRWFRDNAKLDFEVVLKKSGALAKEFAELAPTAVFERDPDSLASRSLEQVRPYRLRHALKKLPLNMRLRNKRFALVYSNTLVNGALLESIPQQDCPLISHSHELEYMIQRSTTPRDLAYTLQRTRQFIAGSRAVSSNLVARHGMSSANIEVVYDFIPFAHIDAERMLPAGRSIRAELGIPDTSFVVGAAGTVDWRKGCDLFIPLALETLRRCRGKDLHFLWVGGFWERRTPREIAYDIDKLGLQGRIHFVDHRQNYLDYMAMFDAFCLMSREDPCPLVLLEAAGLGKPLLCFSESGGAPELVEADCGFVVPYLDVATMASRLVDLMDAPDLRTRFAARASEKVRERHDVAVAGPRILEIIGRCLEKNQ
jgi:glycosyltransferase involved in cell wall biosynthesis